MTQQRPPREYPAQCPECGEVAANPLSVRTESTDKIVVTMRCHKCQHLWEEAKTTVDLFRPGSLSHN